MKAIMVRYKAKPEMVQENERLIGKVFEALKASAPKGLRYTSVKFADGQSFAHIVEMETDSSALTDLDAFKAFTKDIKDRCVEPPQSSEITIVGNYRFFGE